MILILWFFFSLCLSLPHIWPPTAMSSCFSLASCASLASGCPGQNGRLPSQRVTPGANQCSQLNLRPWPILLSDICNACSQTCWPPAWFLSPGGACWTQPQAKPPVLLMLLVSYCSLHISHILFVTCRVAMAVFQCEHIFCVHLINFLGGR